jgi:hypothetical protein
MPSVQDELRARVVELDTEIRRQRDSEVLKDLERDRSLVRRQLNALIDPVARLPVEISSEIFIQSLPPFPQPGAIHIPMLLLNICNTWRDIALSTPSLWAAIHITIRGLPPRTRGLRKLVSIWLERARDRPLSISLAGANYDHSYDHSVVDIIWRHAHRLRHLELQEGGDDDMDYSIPLWGDTSPGALPSLETVTIRGVNGTRGFYPSHFCELLRLALNLVECLFCDMETNFDDTSETLTLPKLRRLMFGERRSYPQFDHHLLRYLSLPGLEELFADVVWSELLSFLRRTSPPLRELALWDESDFPLLAECLRLVPDLGRFELWYTYSPTVKKLFAALAESTSLLPQLRTLVIQVEEVPPNCHSFWMTLLRALVARRTRIQAFHCMVFRRLPDSKLPAPDIIAAFRELVMDGMEIQISALREAWNYVID